MDSQKTNSPLLITAAGVGELPDDGPVTVGGVRVARGHRIYASEKHHPGLPAQGWEIEELDPAENPNGLWHRLAAEFARTGLWPILGADDDYLVPAWERHYLWRDDACERPTDIRGLFGLDSREHYDIQEDDYCFECGVVEDRSGELRIPGVAPDAEGLADTNRWARSGSRVTLVPALRPADAVAQLGWSGGINAGWYGGDAVYVLRSWEERFGAYLVHAGRSTLEVTVTRPPRTIAEAQLVAREHFHFCRYDSQFHGVGGIGPYVANLVGNRSWRFWWD